MIHYSKLGKFKDEKERIIGQPIQMKNGVIIIDEMPNNKNVRGHWIDDNSIFEGAQWNHEIKLGSLKHPLDTTIWYPQKRGHKCRIVDGTADHRWLTVEFEDGKISTDVPWASIQPKPGQLYGEVLHPEEVDLFPNLEKGRGQRESWIGRHFKSRDGEDMVVIGEHNGHRYLDLLFPDGKIAYHQDQCNVIRELVPHPDNSHKGKAEGRIGETLLMNCGYYFTITAYRDNKHIDGIFHDGSKNGYFIKDTDYTQISTRTLAHPERKHRHLSINEYTILYYLKEFGFEKHPKRGDDKIPWEIDAFSDKYKIGIEYDGEYWHNPDNEKVNKTKNPQEKELAKNKDCADNGVTLIRVREEGLPCLDSTSIDLVNHGKSAFHKEFEDFLKNELIPEINKHCPVEINPDINFDRDVDVILGEYNCEELPATSLYYMSYEVKNAIGRMTEAGISTSDAWKSLQKYFDDNYGRNIFAVQMIPAEVKTPEDIDVDMLTNCCSRLRDDMKSLTDAVIKKYQTQVSKPAEEQRVEHNQEQVIKAKTKDRGMDI